MMITIGAVPVNATRADRVLGGAWGAGFEGKFGTLPSDVMSAISKLKQNCV